MVLSGRSISTELSKFSKDKHVTQIVIGHSEKSIFQSFFTGTTTSQLLQMTRNIAIHVIPLKNEVGETPSQRYSGIKLNIDIESTVGEYFTALWIVVGVSLLDIFILRFIGYRAVGFIFLLAVLIISLFASFIPIVLSSLACAMIWDFFFIPPFGTLHISRPDDLLMFTTFFIVAIVSGVLTYRIRSNEKMLLVRENWNEAIYKIVYTIAGSEDKVSCISEIEKQLDVMLPGEFHIIAKDAMNEFDKTLEARTDLFSDKKELSVARWAFEKSSPAGWATETLMSAKAIYIPLKGPSETVGVLAYEPYKQERLSMEQANLIMAISNQIAVYLEKELSAGKSHSRSRSWKNRKSFSRPFLKMFPMNCARRSLPYPALPPR